MFRWVPNELLYWRELNEVNGVSVISRQSPVISQALRQRSFRMAND